MTSNSLWTKKLQPNPNQNLRISTVRDNATNKGIIEMKKNLTGLSKGLGQFSKLNKDDAAFAKKPLPTTARSPKGKPSKFVETLTSEPSFRGNTAFRPLAAPKIKRHFAG
jgi:hypothetical protein